MSDELDLAVNDLGPAPVAVQPPTPEVPLAPVSAPAVAAPIPAHVQVDLDLAAKETAVQDAIARVKTESAVIQADAAAAKIAKAAALVVPEPEFVSAVATPCGAEEIEESVVPELDPMQRLEAAEAKIAELERHVVELIAHLAQSFGDVYKVKKDLMGV